MRPLASLPLFFLLALGTAAAGTAQDPEVRDPAGDAGPNGVPAPLFASWDVVAAWFGPPAEGVVVLTIQVADGASAPPSGEVGVTFRVGEQHWIAGYTVVPGIYGGGFLSRSDANGDVPADETPMEAEATFADDLVTVRIPLEELNATGALSFEEPWGWSEYRATNGEDERLDRTDAGRTATFMLDEGAGSGMPDPAGGAPTPGPLVATVALALAGAATMRRR